jgi:hypothetical protein
VNSRPWEEFVYWGLTAIYAVVLTIAFSVPGAHAQTTIAPTQVRPGVMGTTWVMQSSPNANAGTACNVLPAVGNNAPYIHLYDWAIQQGTMGLSGDVLWICMAGTNGLGVWVQVGSAP